MLKELMLMPCPNDCKHGLVNVFEYPSGNLEESRDLYQVACACGVRGPMKDSRKAAITAWNALPRRLRWTKENQTEPGWYWFRYPNGRKFVWHVSGDVVTSHKGVIMALDKVQILGGEWAGPIQEPEEATA